MIKVAFTSCMSQQFFPSQPVWSRIQAQNPDYLVLLGDSVYLDFNANPRKMGDDEFGRHVHSCYRAQLAVPEFDQLLRHMAAKGGRRSFAVWDDHDFLWNDSAGAAIAAIPEHRDKIPRSRAGFKAFREALVNVGGFPDRFEDIYPPPQPSSTPLYESVELSDGSWLHLTDGRTYRTETLLVGHEDRAILGAQQLAWLKSQVLAPSSSAVHLVASGSTSSSWRKFRNDWTALSAIADERRMLMLSGDIHHNDFISHVDSKGVNLYEAISSGAALRSGVIVGAKVQNFGMAEIDEFNVRIRYFEKTGEQQAKLISRMNWMT